MYSRSFPHRKSIACQGKAAPDGDAVYADHANARHVYGRLSGTESGRMPLGGPYWSLAMLQIFSDWMKGGFLP
jgi:hypothetical protein